MTLGVIGDEKITAYIDASFAIYPDIWSHTTMIMMISPYT